MLWSIVENVGEDGELPALDREDAPIECAEPFHPMVPNVFVSHNHHDAAAADGLAQRLVAVGVRPWLYTSGIEQRAPIIESVRQVLRQCWGLVAS